MLLVDCQGLAGHDTLGAVQAGFKLARRCSLGKFGDEIVAANRHLLGGHWEQDPGNSAAEWEPVECSLVLGTPPCSGFSLLNTSKTGANARGPESAINSCMRELVTFAARCSGEDGRRGAPFIIFESVQQAYSQGRGLMQQLREIAERESGEEYSITHVLMSGSAIGAAQFRHRYFFVAHRMPFGVDPPDPRTVATVYDAIGDLRDLEDMWAPQPYIHPLTRYAQAQRLRWPDETAVTAHVTNTGTSEDLFLELLLDYWLPGETHEAPLRRYIEHDGRLPGRSIKWWDADSYKSNVWGGPRRLHWNQPGYVLTGNSLRQFIHPEEPRFLTARECSRLMGLPDEWIWPDEKGNRVSSYIGKCCPVQSARWIARWARYALEGNPGAPGGKIGEREFLTNTTHAYKSWPVGVEQRELVLA